MKPLVLIPGFMCDDRLFEPQIKALSKLSAITVAISKEKIIHDMAAETLAQTPGQFALGGLSMDGIIALEILRQAPDRITHLALMDTTPLADAPANYDIRRRQIADVHAGRLGTIMRDELKPAYLVESPRKKGFLDTCITWRKALAQTFLKLSPLRVHRRKR
jgi:pimeloyl-ACP methyl ester carboxylesterase